MPVSEASYLAEPSEIEMTNHSNPSQVSHALVEPIFKVERKQKRQA
jgi:hypothetical protein